MQTQEHTPGSVLYADIVFIVDQNILAAKCLAEFQISLILPDQFLCIQSAVIHTVLYVAGMILDKWYFSSKRWARSVFRYEMLRQSK